MHRRLFLVSWLALCLTAARVPAATPKLIVTIVVDQMRYDYLERFYDQFSRRGFRLLMDHGAFMTAAEYDYIPTVTAPGHASYLSGAPPSVHGIIGNDWFDRQKRKAMSAVYDPASVGVGTTSTNVHVSPRNFIGSNFADEMRLRYGSKVVGISMKDRGAVFPAGRKPAGAFWFEARSGHFVTSSYYMSELPGWLQAFNARAPAERYRSAQWTRLLSPQAYGHPDAGGGEGHLLGETNSIFPHTLHFKTTNYYDAILPTPYADTVLAELARAAIEGEHLGQTDICDLLCISFSALDGCGHTFGPDSQEVQDLLLRLDRTLESLFAYLDRKIGLNHMQIVLTADHGVAPLPAFLRQQGVAFETPSSGALRTNLNQHIDARFGAGHAFVLSSFYYGNLYYDFAKLKELHIDPDELSEVIREWAYSTGKFQAAYTRRQLLQGDVQDRIGRAVLNGYNAERSGDIVLVPKPYVLPGLGSTGTTHGSPYHYDTHVPVLFYGAAFKPGRYADPFNITDIVPTLCAVLKLNPPPGCVGHAFTPALTGR